MRGINSGKAFRANYHGKCRECKKPYEPGSLILGQGKGYGAIHAACAPTAGLVTRQMTDEERSRVGRPE